MDVKIISNWVRQTRYRAKSSPIYNDLHITDVQAIVVCFNGECAYCGSPANTLDHPFPLKSNAPNMPSNVLPICKRCKSVKKSHDIVWMFSLGHITSERYLGLLAHMFGQRGGEHIKEHVRKATGIEE